MGETVTIRRISVAMISDLRTMSSAHRAVMVRLWIDEVSTRYDHLCSRYGDMVRTVRSCRRKVQ